MANHLYGSAERPTPLWREYFAGIQKLQPQDNRREMLRIHFLAPNRTITATEMTRQVWNGAGHDTANMQYGTLARDIGEKMSIKIAQDEQAVNLLVAFGNMPDGGWT